MVAGLLFAADFPSEEFFAEEADAVREASNHERGPGKPAKRKTYGGDWQRMDQQQRELTAKTKNEQLSPKERIDAARQLSNLQAQAVQLVKNNPNSWDDQAGGAGFFLQGGNYSMALESADRALELGSPDGDPGLTAKVLCKRGAAKWYSGDVRGALQDGLTALQLDSESREAVELVQYTKGRANRTEEGVASSDQGEAADKERLKNRLDASVPHSKEEWLARIDERQGPLLALLGKASEQRKMRNFAAAARYDQAALDYDPSDPMARAMLGLDQNLAGRHNDAVLNLTLAIQAGWDDAGLFGHRAKALVNQGGPERARAALKDAELAIRLDPDHAVGWSAHGMAQLELAQGLTDESRKTEAIGKALQSLKRAAELDPAQFGAFYDQMRQTYDKRLGNLAQNGQAGAQQDGGDQAHESAGSNGAGSGGVQAAGASAKTRSEGGVEKGSGTNWALIGFSAVGVALIAGAVVIMLSPGQAVVRKEEFGDLNPKYFHKDGRPRTDPGKFRGVDDITI